MASLGVTIVEKWATWPETVRKPRHTKMNTALAERGMKGKPPDRINPSIWSVNTIGRKNAMTTECVSMQSDVSNGNTLLLLVDTGADISLLKSYNLDKTRQFDLESRAKVKSVS
jgi:hypothetical protein